MLRAVLWRTTGWCRRAGWGGALTLLVLSVGGLAYVLLIRPMAIQSQALRDEITSIGKTIRPILSSKASLKPLDELGSFYEFFPQSERMPDLLDRIYRAAAEQGVALDKGDYQLSSEREIKLIRYDIAFPVKGGYPQVRRFVAQVLNDVPSLALESIVFSRQRINDPQVDAAIKFTLYMRPAP